MDGNAFDKEVLEAQSSAFLLMGSIIRTMPEKEQLRALVSDKVFDEVPYARNQPDVQKGLALLGAWGQGYRDDDFDAVYDDCMTLLVGPGKPFASPWESAYSETNPGLLFQQETLEVRRDYQALDLQVPNQGHEPDDNIAYEMEFVSVLCRKASEALAAGDEGLARAACDAKSRFLRRHLLRWGFRWCDRMIDNAKTDYYRGMALLIRGFLMEAKEGADSDDPDETGRADG